MTGHREGTGRARAATPSGAASLAPYVPDLCAGWPRGALVREVEGTLVSADLSGFTALSERLARLGRAGTEEMTGAVSGTLSRLVDAAVAHGGDVVSFGGDAILVLFAGPAHGVRGCAAAWAMRAAIAEHGTFRSSLGPVRLRLAVGVHSGCFVAVRIGERQSAVAVTGPDATRTVELEALAGAGRVALSPGTAALARARTRPLPGRPGCELLTRRPDAQAVEAPPRRRRTGLRRWVPEAIAREVLAVPGTATHRTATVGFVGVSGLDGPQAGRDGRLDALRDVASRVEAQCADLGVTWLGWDIAPDGVKLIVAAGVPDAQEDDEERLLLVLRRVLDGIDGPLAVRCGAARGHVFAGDVGHPARRTYTVMGDTVNLAARLMGTARPGQAVVTTSLAAVSTRRFAVSGAAHLAVRGRRERVQVAVLGDAGARSRVAPEGRLTGRDAEVRAVREALATEGGAGAVEVVGAPGMGKTHLLRDAVAGLGCAAGWGIGDPLARSVAFSALAPALRELLGVEARCAAVTRLAAAVGDDMVPWGPLVADALGVECRDTAATRALDPAFRQARLHEVMVDLFARRGGRGVLVLDDAQWADRSSLSLLRALARDAARTGVAVVAVRRDTYAEAVLDPAPVVRLGPLTWEAARDLALATAGDRALPDDALDRILATAAGHPFFVRQLVAVAETGLQEVPDDVERVVNARVDLLDPADRLLLRRAAVAGRAVAPSVLAAALGDARVVQPATWRPLAEFVQWTPGEVRFRHDLYREAAYGGLAVRERRELHAAVGAALLADTPRDRRPAVYPALATHFHAAGRPRLSGRYAQRAARSAASRAAWAEAANLWGIALDAARALRDDPERVADIGAKLSLALERLGRTGEALEALRPVPGASDGMPAALRRIARARLAQRLGRIGFALRETAVARRMATQLDGAERADIETRALLRRASVRQHQGRHGDALRLASAATGIAPKALLGQATAQAYYAEGSLGRPTALDTGGTALRLLRSARRHVEVGDLLNNMAVDDHWRGEWPHALDLFLDSARAYARAGDSTGAALSANNAAQVLIDQGRLAEGLRELGEARRVFQAADDAFMIGVTDSALATAATRSGDLAAAREHLEHARRTHLAVGADDYVLDADLRRVELLLAEGLAGEARSLARRCIRSAEASDAGEFPGRWAGRLLAQAMGALGQLAAADRRLRQAVADARKASAPADLALALWVREGVMRLRGDAPPEEVVAERLTLLRRLGVVWLPAPFPGLVDWSAHVMETSPRT